MSGESPASILYSSDGYELAAISGNSIPSGTRGLLVEGSDGTNSRFITVDASGRVVVAGAGVAGTPAGGVVSVQGVAGGTAIPISGTVTANNASVSTTGTAPPGSATYIGGSVTTAAPAYTTGQMNALSLTTTGLLRIDGSGVTQPVSGTITANIGTTGGLALDATLAKLTIAQSTALGSNTQALVGGSVTTAAPTYTTGNINPFSLTTAGALRVDGSGVTQPVSGTVTANIGTTNGLALDTSVNGILVAQGSTTSGEKGPLIQGAVTTAAPAYTTAQTSPLSLTTTGLLRVDGSGVTQPVSIASAVTVAQATAANLNATVVGTTAAGSGAATGLVTVQGNASGTPIPVSGFITTNKATVAAVTSVVGATTNTVVLASNANRILAALYNNTNKIMYAKCGTTASLTSFTIALYPNSYWEVPSDFTGEIDAVWANGVSGSVLVTELTP